MSKTPKASFVIPAFNAQTFIAQAVQSCLNQTVKAIEVVIVNDGSTDNTERIVKSLMVKDERVKLINQENQGRCIARNVGNKASTGEWVFVLDADDIALPTRVSDTFAYLKKNPGVDIVYGKFHGINALGDIIGLAEVEPFSIEKVKQTGLTFIGHSTMAYSRRVLDLVNYSPGEWDRHCIDDWYFQICAYKAKFRFGACNKIFSQYRINPKQRDEAMIKAMKDECLKSV